MEEYIKEMGCNIAIDLIAMEDKKGDTKRPQGQTLYHGDTERIMEELKIEVLSQMGYNNLED